MNEKVEKSDNVQPFGQNPESGASVEASDIRGDAGLPSRREVEMAHQSWSGQATTSTNALWVS